VKWIKKTLNLVQILTEYVLCLLLGAMVVIVFAQVIFRFVLHASLPWSEESARYIMVWISLLGASIGVRRKAHIGIEAVVMLLKAPLRKTASVVATSIAAIFFAGMVYYGLGVLRVVVNQISPAMEISMAIPYGSLIIGGALMLLYSLEELLCLLLPNPREKGGAL